MAGRLLHAEPSRALIGVLKEPRTAAAMELEKLDLAIRLAQRCFVAGRLHRDLEHHGVLDRLPARARRKAAQMAQFAERSARSLRWETRMVSQVLSGVAEPVIVLKGGAYALAGSPAARGRVSSDLDILVPRDQLPAAEAALHAAGWRINRKNDNPYDQAYYRDYMHELPPMMHRERGTTLDLHHAILPPVSRTKVDMAAMIAQAVPVQDLDLPGISLFTVEDRFLHSAAHLFADGEVAGQFRNLLELYDQFGELDSMQRQSMMARAQQLGLGRPAWYALHYIHGFFGDCDALAARDGIRNGRPNAIVRWLMDRLVGRCLMPQLPEAPVRGWTAAQFLLYVRSHWLRMPFVMLLRHLIHQAQRQRKEARERRAGQAAPAQNHQ